MQKCKNTRHLSYKVHLETHFKNVLTKIKIKYCMISLVNVFFAFLHFLLYITVNIDQLLQRRLLLYVSKNKDIYNITSMLYF